MKKNHIIALLAAAILIAGIFVAGCTQDSGSSASPAGNSQQVTQSSTESQTGTADSRSNSNRADGGQQYAHVNGDHQSGGQNFLTNETLVAAAAGKLGVSEQDLKNTLTSTTNATSGRPDLSAAAQQLGITEQQLTDALGFPTGAGGFRGSRGDTTASPASVQPT
jgi:hypothetical protein